MHAKLNLIAKHGFKSQITKRDIMLLKTDVCKIGLMRKKL